MGNAPFAGGEPVDIGIKPILDYVACVRTTRSEKEPAGHDPLAIRPHRAACGRATPARFPTFAAMRVVELVAYVRAPVARIRAALAHGEGSVGQVRGATLGLGVAEFAGAHAFIHATLHSALVRTLPAGGGARLASVHALLKFHGFLPLGNGSCHLIPRSGVGENARRRAGSPA